MFNFKSVVDQVAQATKTPLTYVEDKAIRANLETLVDAYVDFTKTAYDTGLEISKQMAEATKSIDYSKYFAKAATAKATK
jgi:hypothetical protein